jgi:hypothetical protein
MLRLSYSHTQGPIAGQSSPSRSDCIMILLVPIRVRTGEASGAHGRQEMV